MNHSWLRQYHLWAIWCCFIPLSIHAQSAHQLLRKGDQHYERSKYAEAAQDYDAALKANSTNDKAPYNLGNALYRQGKYEEAAKYLNNAAKSATAPAEKADAFHNLGNALLQQQKYAPAIEAYQNSLRLRPGDTGSKRNLQLAKHKLKEQQEKQQQDQQQQQNQNQQDQQQNQQQPQQDTKQQQPQNPQPPQEEQRPKLPDNQKQLLEAIGREDRQNKRKYQEQTQSKHARARKKDW